VDRVARRQALVLGVRATTDATTMLTTGTLQTAPCPAGTTPQGLQAKVLNYFVDVAKGLVAMVNPTGSGTDLTSITDVDNPTTTNMLEPADVIVGVQDVQDAPCPFASC
jgi:hypothetical protein